MPKINLIKYHLKNNNKRQKSLKSIRQCIDFIGETILLNTLSATQHDIEGHLIH